MTLAPLQRHAAPPLGRAQVEAEAERLAAALLARLIHDTPRRAATMTRAGDAKYRDVPGHAFAAGDMLDHLRGARTWAVTLGGRDGCAVAGCRDYDAGGAVVVVEALRTAAAAGLAAFAILMPGAEGEHDGGHVWILYRRPAPVADIRHQLAQLPGERGELYPSGNAVRLPLGRHTRKATRGTLVLQDGRRFDLDNGRQLTEAARALVALQRNAPPPAAPLEAHRKAAGLGAAPLDPAAWQDVTAEQGADLMAAARYRALFQRRPQLRALAEGRRVTILTDTGADDTGSQQLATLISNLLTTGRSATPGGDFVPGLGAPPLAEVRAVALHWRATLRPACTLGAYQLDVDRLITKYTPAGYEPEPTRIGALLGTPAPALPELPAPAHRGRPRGAQAAQVERLAALLAPGALVTRAGLAEVLGCTPRTVTTLLATLRTAGRAELVAEARGLRVVRVENNSPLAEVVEGRSMGPASASESGVACRENTRAPLPPLPGAPAAGDASASADDRPAQVEQPAPALSLAELVAEAVDNYGTRGGRAALARVVAHVQKLGERAYHPRAIEGVYRAELQRRRFARADQQREQRYARLDLAALQKKRRNAERRVAEGLAEQLPAAPPSEFRADLPPAERLARWSEKRAARAKARRQLPIWQREHAAIEQAIAAKLPRVSAEAEEAALLAELDQAEARSPRPLGGRRPAVTLRPAEGPNTPRVCSPLNTSPADQVFAPAGGASAALQSVTAESALIDTGATLAGAEQRARLLASLYALRRVEAA